VKTLERDLSLAQETVLGFDIQDDSTLAYVSCLVALETVMPFSNSAEMDFSVIVEDERTVRIDPRGNDIGREELAAINLIASHYYHSKRCNLPVLVH